MTIKEVTMEQANQLMYYVLRHKLVKVPEDEYYRAENRWYRFWNHEKPDIDDFHRFLKIPSKWWCDVGYIAVTPAAARKIALLNSPHYHALLMAYKSKNLPQK